MIYIIIKNNPPMGGMESLIVAFVQRYSKSDSLFK